MDHEPWEFFITLNGVKQKAQLAFLLGPTCLETMFSKAGFQHESPQFDMHIKNKLKIKNKKK